MNENAIPVLVSSKKEELTPSQIVMELDKYIVGQANAKKSVAIALRNRFRRKNVDAVLRDDIIPKNIIMIGPTGVGKTEIARRLAKMVNAPFVKVEATKFTEVGYVGRDVDSIIRDLVENAVSIVRAERMEIVEKKAKKNAENRLVNILMMEGYGKDLEDPEELLTQNEQNARRRKYIRRLLASGELDRETIEIEVQETQGPVMIGGMDDMGVDLGSIFGNMMPTRTKKRKVTVPEALRVFTQEESQKLIDMEEVSAEAVEKTEQMGIVFLDEIDKIAGSENRNGADVSRGGVQRDILPLVEGATVNTKYGQVRTDHILFIAAGAFHVAKPSDLMPELQGRFPIRVELDSLTAADYRRILAEPQNSLLKQYAELLKADEVYVEFTDDGITAMAEIANRINEEAENIGARRLHTIMEKVLEELLFSAPDLIRGNVVIDKNYVEDRMNGIVKNEDLTKYIL
ncbi:MAG: ATP-dependent protease ATPase subunit HslU [Firmicutes bacterium]|nr:ATP-dependent protease ATPase subunit HslU [Bacillota bacterium]